MKGISDSILSPVRFTAPQQRAVAERGGDLIVSASAGSGKTTVMIARMLELMKEGVPVTRMLAVTFAAAQAEDMKAKLVEKLTQLLSLDTGLSAEQTAFLTRQLGEIPYADISTLHSFCAELVRSYFFAVDVPADFVIASQLDSELAASQALERVLEKNQALAAPQFLAVQDAFSKKRSAENLKYILRRIRDMFVTMPETADFSERSLKENYFYEETAEKERAAACGHWRKVTADWLPLLTAPGLEKLYDLMVMMSEYCVPETFGIAPTEFPPVGCRDKSPAAVEIKEEVKKMKASLTKSAHDFLESKNLTRDYGGIALVSELIRLNNEFEEAFAALKRADGVLDFGDLETFALRILSDETRRTEIRKRYDCVFVDEYQDINPMQEELLRLVSPPGSLFMVGDVKQSIYGFRLCEPKIFSDKCAVLDRDGRLIRLNDNFRSEEGILGFCNQVFDRIMTLRFGGTDYSGTARLTGGKAAGEFPSVRVRILKTEKSRSGEAEEDGAAPSALGVYSVKDDERRTGDESRAYFEGVAAAEEILAALKTVTIDGGGVRRRAEFSDCAVLLRSLRGSAAAFVRALKDCGIPVALKNEDDLLSSSYVGILVDLMRVILNPQNDYPLCAVMMSPLFGFTEEEMSAIRMTWRAPDKAEDYFYSAVYAAVEKQDALGKKLKSFFGTLSDYRMRSAYQKPSVLLREVIAESGYESAILDTPDGLASVKSVQTFCAQLAHSKYDTNLAVCLSYLDGIGGKLTVDTSVRGQNSVTVCSMHKAKGLEYPIAVLAMLDKRFDKSDGAEDVLISRAAGIVTKNFDTATRTKSPHYRYDCAAREISYRAREEELRILYVAMTRAKSRLILVGASPLDKKFAVQSDYSCAACDSHLEWLLGALSADGLADGSLAADAESKTDRAYSLTVTDIKMMTAGVTEEVHLPLIGAADPVMLDALNKRAAFRYAYKTDIPPKTTVTKINSASAPTPYIGALYEEPDASGVYGPHSPVDETEARLGLGGADTGNAYHAFMQYIDLKAPSEGAVRAQLKRLTEEGRLTETAASLIDCVRIFKAISSPSVCLAASAKECAREQKFVFRLSADKLGYGSADFILVQGVIDLLFETEKGVVIVDYKTTKGSPEMLREMYTKQMDMYALACEGAGYRVAKKLLYSFVLGCEIEM